MIRGFGTSLFNMVPKDNINKHHMPSNFGTSLFDIVPKERTFWSILFCHSVFIAINNIFCYNIYRVLEEL